MLFWVLFFQHLTFPKANGWIPKMIGLEKDHSLQDTAIFGINSLDFWGVKPKTNKPIKQKTRYNASSERPCCTNQRGERGRHIIPSNSNKAGNTSKRCPNQGVERGRISLQKSWINTNNTADDEEKSGGQALVDNGESPKEIYIRFQLIRRSSSIVMYKICLW